MVKNFTSKLVLPSSVISMGKHMHICACAHTHPGATLRLESNIWIETCNCLFQTRSEVVVATIFAWMMETFKEPYSSLHRTHLSAKTHKDIFKGQALVLVVSQICFRLACNLLAISTHGSYIRSPFRLKISHEHTWFSFSQANTALEEWLHSNQHNMNREGERGMNVTVGKPDKCHLSQVTKVNINSDESYCMCPWSDAMSMTLYLCGLPSQTHNLSLTMGNTSDKPKFKDTFQSTWPLWL